jgi:hypothetical protein
LDDFDAVRAKSPSRHDNISGKECRISEAEYVGLYKL